MVLQPLSSCITYHWSRLLDTMAVDLLMRTQEGSAHFVSENLRTSNGGDGGIVVDHT